MYLRTKPFISCYVHKKSEVDLVHYTFSLGHVKNLVNAEKIQDVNYLRNGMINYVVIIISGMLATMWEEVEIPFRYVPGHKRGIQ